MPSERNKTIRPENLNIEELYKGVKRDFLDISSTINTTIHGDSTLLLKKFPDSSIDLIIVDPPYNLSKIYAGTKFKASNESKYEERLELWMSELQRIAKPNASIYVCCDWMSSISVYSIMKKYFTIINRITWEREKGRGASRNRKNCIEDIYFGVMNKNDYTFNLDDVKLKRKVIAPYKNENGESKDWEAGEDGNFRMTSPSNIWTDISIPFWSMPENTTHPTQKPEKLIAKIVLASSKIGDIVLDPFLGSGTTSVVAKKLGRRYIGIEKEKEYTVIAEYRLKNTEKDTTIQGYENGVFWERNTLQERIAQKRKNCSKKKASLH